MRGLSQTERDALRLMHAENALPDGVRPVHSVDEPLYELCQELARQHLLSRTWRPTGPGPRDYVVSFHLTREGALALRIEGIA